MKNTKISVYLRMMRVNQWIKNLVVYTAIVFSGALFEPGTFMRTSMVFILFCLLSSGSYILNDIIDYPYDKKHPVKKFRPIASGQASIPEATFMVFIIIVIAIVLSLSFPGESISIFVLSLVFLMVHFFYSLYLKRFPIFDIFAISVSFMIRAFAGEVVSGHHIPIWLILTIFFGALFMATVKRHAELVGHGTGTRLALYQYKEHLLFFLTNTFATATIMAYSTYTYFLQSDTTILTVFTGLFPRFESRKWMMITIPFIVYGIARYTQLLYQKVEGERPEKIVTTDVPLITTIILWGICVILLIYAL